MNNMKQHRLIDANEGVETNQTAQALDQYSPSSDFSLQYT